MTFDEALPKLRDLLVNYRLRCKQLQQQGKTFTCPFSQRGLATIYGSGDISKYVPAPPPLHHPCAV